MKLDLGFSFRALLLLGTSSTLLGVTCIRADVDEVLPAGAGGSTGLGGGGSPGDGGNGSGGRAAGIGGAGGVGVGGSGVGGSGVGGSGGSGAGGSGTGGRGAGGSGVGGSGTGGSGTGGRGAGGSGVGGSGTGGRGAGGSGSGGDTGAGGRVAISPTVAGQLVIAEVMVDTTVAADDVGEWFEIYNPNLVETFDLFNCLLKDSNSNMDVIGRHVTIPAQGIVTLARSVDATLGFVPTYAYTNVKLGNTGDLVSLTCNAVLIDEVNFLMMPPWLITKGRSFSLNPVHFSAVDNDNPLNWCPGTIVYNTLPDGSSTDYGTPGVRNPPCP